MRLPTPTQRLATSILGEPVQDFILRLRADERSLDYIARSLAARTDGQIVVTVETIRKWLLRAERVAA